MRLPPPPPPPKQKKQWFERDIIALLAGIAFAIFFYWITSGV